MDLIQELYLYPMIFIDGCMTNGKILKFLEKKQLNKDGVH